MNKKRFNVLTKKEKDIIIGKRTEPAYTGEYESNFSEGIYICRRCNAVLYRSEDKFDAHCGWPSFDDEIPGAVKRMPDPDGKRTEIICANCKAYLGHVFEGEHLTRKNIRHCVNSISMRFIPRGKERLGRSIFAGGCFWGIEHHMKRKRGVIKTAVGYTGGKVKNPTYEQVCRGDTGHVEAVEVLYDPIILTYEDIVKFFFEIHDPEQADGQGPDIGEQYRSYIFYLDDKQKKTAQKLIDILKKKGYDVATTLRKAGVFWKAEDYHQDYYTKKGSLPYCHFYTKRF